MQNNNYKDFGIMFWQLCLERIFCIPNFQNVILTIIKCKKNWLQQPDLSTNKISYKRYKFVSYIKSTSNILVVINFYTQSILLKYRNEIKS